jgi:hypothetical protein
MRIRGDQERGHGDGRLVWHSSQDLFGTAHNNFMRNAMDILLSSREVGISTMRLTLVQTSHEDKRPVRSEAMVMVKVFSL